MNINSEYRKELNLQDLEEIGHIGNWKVSSAKPGHGVDKLRDNRLDTYWQSDGNSNHHFISVIFPSAIKIKQISLYLNIEEDDSYTPVKIAILCGNDSQDAKITKKLELTDPKGWIAIPMRDNLDLEEDTIVTRYIKIVVLGNHNHGKDSHIRQIHIFEPCHIKIPEYLNYDDNHSNLIDYHNTFDPEIFGL